MSSAARTPSNVSVIVPTLNEAAYLPRTVRSLALRGGDELIVVDGGSVDETPAVAARCGAHRVISAPPGRARQLNAGAALARGAVLLFLHADTTLSEGALEAVRRAMRDRRVVGGAFRLRIDSASRTVRGIAPVVNARSRWLGLPYGDQGIFIRREVFEAMDGFADLPMMEDVELVRRMRRRGRLALLGAAATTSGRRWEAHGVVRTTLANVAALLAYQCGVPAPRVKSLYRRMLRPRTLPPQAARDTVGGVSREAHG